jgi:hypothetical protein
MPEEYVECVKYYVGKGVSERTAKARCAAAFYKKHGKTVNEAHAEGTLPEIVKGADKDTVELIMMDLEQLKEYSSTFSTIKAGRPKKDEIKLLHGKEMQSVNTDMLDEFNIIEVVAAKVGSSGYTADGRAVEWTLESLEDAQSTWLFGRVSVNHNDKDYGRIISSFVEGDELRQLAKVDDILKEWIKKSAEIVGVSTEAKRVFVDMNSEIIKATGTGLTFVFPPDVPACSPEEGCVVIMATEKKEDGENVGPERTEGAVSSTTGAVVSGTAAGTGFVTLNDIPVSNLTYTTDGTWFGDWNTFHPHWTENPDWSKYVIQIWPTSVPPDNNSRDTLKADESRKEDGETMADEKKEETVCAKVHTRVVAEKEELAKAMAEQTKEIESLKATVAKFNEIKKAEMLEVLKAEKIDVELFKDESIPVIEKTIQAIRAYKKAEDAVEEVNSGATVTATIQENVPSGDVISQAMSEADAEKARIETELKEVERIEKKARDMGYE